MKPFLYLTLILVAGQVFAAQPTGEFLFCDNTHPKYADCQRKLDQQKADAKQKANQAQAAEANREMAEFQKTQRAKAEAQRQEQIRNAVANYGKPSSQAPTGQGDNIAFQKCRAENRDPNVCRKYATPQNQKELDRQAEMDRRRQEMNRQAEQQRAMQGRSSTR